jgi:hypothetical protein
MSRCSAESVRTAEASFSLVRLHANKRTRREHCLRNGQSDTTHFTNNEAKDWS